MSITLALGLAPPNDVPGCTSCVIHFLSGSILFSSHFSISALAAISSRISVKGGIFNDSLTLINSPSRSSLKRNPPIREKSSIPVKKSKDDNLRIGRFSSAAAICSRRNNKVRPQRSGKASEKHPNISLSGCVYCCPG